MRPKERSGKENGERVKRKIRKKKDTISERRRRKTKKYERKENKE